MRFLLAVFLFLAGCSMASTPFELPRDATVPLHAPDSDVAFCSGVMIAPHMLLTAAHCAKVEHARVGDKEVKVLKIDEDRDVALLEVDHDCPCVPVAKADVGLDDQLVVVGYPMNNLMGVEIVTEGRAQGHADTDGDSGKLRMNVPVAPGNSGGGVFVNRLGRWELVGIVSAMAQRCDGYFLSEVCHPLTHLSLAVSLESIHKLLSA